MNTYAASLFLIAAMTAVGLWLEHINIPDKLDIGDWFFRAIPLFVCGIFLAVMQHMW